MKYSVGYQYKFGQNLIDIISENLNAINEVYFSLSGYANGRSPSLNESDNEKQLKTNHLKQISSKGVKLNFLLNANCYGAKSLSTKFYDEIANTLDSLINNLNLSGVTTTSPLIAEFVKTKFPTLEVRASVNMGIGEVEGFEYVKDYFDSFYLKREYNRNLNKIITARKWCDDNGKKLYGLANSGCLNFCSIHAFHDNLVAHEGEILQNDDYFDFEGQCFTYLSSISNAQNYLKISNFIRPEDVNLYEEYFDGLKLATRVTNNALRIIKGYLNNRYVGSVNDLLEPNHSQVFYPKLIENSLIDKDFTKTVLNCNKNCSSCNYCKNILKKAIITL